MSGPMDPGTLALIREEADRLRVRAPHCALVRLLDDRDHQAKRADDAEANAGKFHATLVELQAEPEDLQVQAATPLHRDSFRARTIEAERLRDLYQAKLREIMGTGFELWLAQLDEIQF